MGNVAFFEWGGFSAQSEWPLPGHMAQGFWDLGSKEKVIYFTPLQYLEGLLSTCQGRYIGPFGKAHVWPWQWTVATALAW